MKRRQFLSGAAAGGVVAASAVASSFPAPAIAQGVRELKMVTTWPKRFPGYGVGAERMAERIKAMTDGKLQIKVFAAGELVPAFESFDAVAAGTADLSHSAAYYWQGKSKAFNFFTAVPFGLNGPEHAAWIKFGGGQKLWDELSAQFKIKPFLLGSTGVQMGGWFRKEVNTLEDFKGLKYRMPGLGGEVMQRLGATVVNLPGGEIFPALQSGTIDGTEWVGPWNDLAFGFYKVAKYYYWPGFHEPSTTGELLVNMNTWESLSAEHKAMLEFLTEAEGQVLFADFNANNGDALDTLVNKHKVELRKFSDELMTAIGKISGEVVAEVGNSDPMAKKVYESFMSFRSKMVAYTKVSEQAFLNARSLPFKFG